MDRQYPSDLTDEQWQLVQGLILPRRRPPLCRRRVLNAILYVNRTGCPWRFLPSDVPDWRSVYTVFWRWRQTGLWERIHDQLREQVRRQAGKAAQLSAAIIDSQSVRTAEEGEERGLDGGKKITGRKRHLAVDTLGLVCAVVVHAAGWQDYDAAAFVFQKLERFRGLRVVFADGAYGRLDLPDWVKSTLGWVLQTVLRPVRSAGFVVLPKRWIVERTFA